MQQKNICRKCRSRDYKTAMGGFTLMEILVYASLFALISLFLVQSLLTVHGAYRKLQSERDVTAAVRTVMTELAREVRESKSIYTPTSRLNSVNGQLALEAATSTGVAYVDFYLDGGRLYVKREGSDALPLTAESVVIGEFRVMRVVAGNRESARITLEATSRGSGMSVASTTVTASFTPRGNY